MRIVGAKGNKRRISQIKQSKRRGAYLTKPVATELRRNLQDLGFPSYAAYQRSELWKGIRLRVMERDDSTCPCGAPARHVHHEQYTLATLKGEDLQYLRAACGGCHLAVHEIGKGDLDLKRISKRRANKPGKRKKPKLPTMKGRSRNFRY